MDKTVDSYAEALFLIAKEENLEEEYLNSLNDVCSVFDENPEYSEFLSSYSISKEKRIESLEKVFSAILPENVLSFLCILCDKRRIKELKEITKEYERLYFSLADISRAYVRSAYPLDDEQKKSVTAGLEKFCGHRVIADFAEDKSLIGGVQAEVDGRVIDTSIRNRLNKLREVMDK